MSERTVPLREVRAMRSSDEWWVYGGAVLLFGAAVLWGADVTGGVVLAVAACGVLAMAFGVWRSRVARRVVVVGPSRTEAVDLVDEALDRAGYGIVSCGGPGVRPCPAESDLPCPIHIPVSGVVIVRDASTVEALPPCERELSAPAVAVDTSDEGVGAFRASLRA